MEKNSIIDNQVENGGHVPKNRNPPPCPPKKVFEEFGPEHTRAVWTKEDPMVRELRTGEPAYGPSPIRCLAEGLPVPGMSEELAEDMRSIMKSYGMDMELIVPIKLAVQKSTKEFVEKRILGQFEYAVSILRSNMPLKRKKDLILSAVGGAVNFALNEGTLDAYNYLGYCLVKFNIQIYED